MNGSSGLDLGFYSGLCSGLDDSEPMGLVDETMNAPLELYNVLDEITCMGAEDIDCFAPTEENGYSTRVFSFKVGDRHYMIVEETPVK